MPYTPLEVDPSSSHLAPPVAEKNFLISPPGSPPEGWRPITEDAPNSKTLAEDLHRALEGLVLNGTGVRREGGKEVILEGAEEEGGVRVEVEDTSLREPQQGQGKGRGEVFEAVEDEGSWRMPGQGQGMRPAPTARPPI